MVQKETAEQKLLKMIEATSGGSTAGATKTEQKVAKKQSVISIIKAVNKFWIIGIAISGFFLFGELTNGLRLINSKFNFSVDQRLASGAVNSASLIPVVQKLSFYLSPIKKRNIFQPYEEKAKNIDTTVKNERLEQRVSNLKLVGISWMDSVDTASVMIEDTAKNVTYFLNKGGKIDDITVKTIYADSAVLGYENEEIIITYDKS